MPPDHSQASVAPGLHLAQAGSQAQLAAKAGTGRVAQRAASRPVGVHAQLHAAQVQNGRRHGSGQRKGRGDYLTLAHKPQPAHVQFATGAPLGQVEFQVVHGQHGYVYE